MKRRPFGNGSVAFVNWVQLPGVTPMGTDSTVAFKYEEPTAVPLLLGVAGTSVPGP